MSEKRLTEQRNPRSFSIDLLTSGQIVDLINSEDRTVPEAVGKERDSIAEAIDLTVESFRNGGRLIYVGAGTSGRLGILDAAEMPPTFGTEEDLVQGVIAGGPGALNKAKEGAEDSLEGGAAALKALGVSSRDFVMGIASSGTTPFVHGALDWARAQGAKTGLLICTYPSDEMLRGCDVVIAPLVGPEVITGSTRLKAGTATKLVLNTISTGAMVQMGKVYGNLMVDLQVTCAKLQDRGERILMETLDVDRARARALLEAAGGKVKVALVMGRLSVSSEEASNRLEEAGGVVSRVLEELR